MLADRPFCFAVVVLIFFLFFRRPISEVARSICYPRVRWWPGFIKFGQRFEASSLSLPKTLESQKHRNFGAISNNFSSWFKNSRRLPVNYRKFSERKQTVQHEGSKDGSLLYWQAGRRLDFAPSPNFVAMATRVGPTTFCMVPLNRLSPKTPW